MNNQTIEFYLPTELWVLIFDKITYNYEGIPLHIKFVCKSWYDIFKYTQKFSELQKNYCISIISNGYFNLLKWAKQKGCLLVETCYYAAKYGNLEILQWARKNKCPWDKDTERALLLLTKSAQVKLA